MKDITIVGSATPSKVEPFRTVIEEAARLTATLGFSITSGGGQGMSSIFLSEYFSAGGKHARIFLPHQENMEAYGDKVDTKATELIYTDLDYPRRNIMMVENSQRVLAITGGLGTLTECIHGIYDFHVPLAVYEPSDIAKTLHSIPECENKFTSYKSQQELENWLRKER